MLWGVFGVWHGGVFPETKIEHWDEFAVWVCRERDHGSGCDYARYGVTSSLARNTHNDGRDLGARVRTWGIGGGEKSI